MTGERTYLGRLIDRGLGRAEVLEPLRPSRFEPTGAGLHAPVGSLFAGVERNEAPRPDRRPVDRTTMARDAAADVPSLGVGHAPSHAAAGTTADPPAPPARAVREARVPEAAPITTSPPRAPSSPSVGETRADGPTAPRPASAAPDGAAKAARAVEPPPASALPPAAPLKIDSPARRAPVAPPPALRAPPPLPVGGRAGDRPAAGRRGEPVERPPAVHVTIGRIEVRAAQPPAPARANRRAAAAAVPLDEYLKRREQGRT